MTFQSPKGVSEYVPPRSALFEEATEAFANSARRACYGRVETAVFEDTALFVRGVGESSDVVRKEMYSFEDRGGRELTLRLSTLQAGDHTARWNRPSIMNIARHPS